MRTRRAGEPRQSGPADVGPQGGGLGPGRDRVAFGRPPSRAGAGRQCRPGPQRNGAWDWRHGGGLTVKKAKADADSSVATSSEPDRRRDILDPRAMRALAHPMRIALLEAIMREGSLTATRAAELLDDSPGNMSWHLQTLAKYGFIEEAGGGRGRSRPWRIVDVSYNFESATSDPEHAAAAEALEATLHQNIDENLRAWWSRRRSYSEEWRRAASRLSLRRTSPSRR